MAKRSKNLKYYEAIGRRKSARALARLYISHRGQPIKVKYGDKAEIELKPGEILVNGQPINKVFSSQIEKAIYERPLQLTDCVDRFAISVAVKGGGRTGQLEAIALSLARAIEKVDRVTYRPLLKQAGLLTRDPRVKERRKAGTGGKARRAKQSPKR